MTRLHLIFRVLEFRLDLVFTLVMCFGFLLLDISLSLAFARALGFGLALRFFLGLDVVDGDEFGFRTGHATRAPLFPCRAWRARPGCAYTYGSPKSSLKARWQGLERIEWR